MPQPSRMTARAGQRVVPGGDHHGDDQHVERQALLGHAEGGPAEGEHDHEDRDHPALPAVQARDQQGDAGLDRAGLHGDADEAADDEDEQRDVDGAEQRRRCCNTLTLPVAGSWMP